MRAIGFVSPALFYSDAHAGISFLERAFGFRTRFVMPDEAGGVLHAELTFRDSVVMVGSARPADRLCSPRDLGGMSMTLSVVVADEELDAHFERAAAAGARITRPLQTVEYGGRGYSADDAEGHSWYFGSYEPGAWWEAPTPS